MEPKVVIEVEIKQGAIHIEKDLIDLFPVDAMIDECLCHLFGFVV